MSEMTYRQAGDYQIPNLQLDENTQYVVIVIRVIHYIHILINQKCKNILL